MKRDLQEVYDFILPVVKEAGALIQEMRKEHLCYNLKSPGQMVSEADKASEKLIIDAIRTRFTDDVILAEESSTDISEKLFTESSWIIDPIDGTTNYLYQHKHTAVSVAYAEAGKVQIGIVYMPFVNEIFTAIRGQGAKLNGEFIRCDQDEINLDKSIVAFGRPKGEQEGRFWALSAEEIFKQCFDIRRLAAASGDIAWIACGRIHAFWETLQPWDIAAACLIAREAGAKIGYISPLPDPMPIPEELYCKGIVVAKPCIFDRLMTILREKYDEVYK